MKLQLSFLDPSFEPILPVLEEYYDKSPFIKKLIDKTVSSKRGYFSVARFYDFLRDNLCKKEVQDLILDIARRSAECFLTPERLRFVIMGFTPEKILELALNGSIVLGTENVQIEVAYSRAFIHESMVDRIITLKFHKEYGTVTLTNRETVNFLQLINYCAGIFPRLETLFKAYDLIDNFLYHPKLASFSHKYNRKIDVVFVINSFFAYEVSHYSYIDKKYIKLACRSVGLYTKDGSAFELTQPVRDGRYIKALKQIESNLSAAQRRGNRN